MMVPFQYRQLSAAIFAALLAQVALATEESSEQNYFQEFPVVLTASRLKQPQSEAPNAMTVIDREMIVASGFRSISDLFKLVPGMYVSYYKGSQPFVAYHGSTDQYARRMQVMIDGRSVYLPPISSVNWASLPITVDDIERIEVIRGPAAASHGANSTQGVISIITRDAGYLDGKRVSYTRGEKGINDVSARFGKRGDTFDYRMTLAYSADNGYDMLTAPPPGKSITQPQVNTLLNNDNDSNQARLLNFTAGYHPNGVDQFDVQLGLNRDVQGVGFIDKNPSANANPYHDLVCNSGFLQLGWKRQLDNASELSFRYYHIQQNQHETSPYFVLNVPLPGLILQSAHTGRDEIEVQHTLSFSASNRIVYGAAYRTDRFNGQTAFSQFPVTGFSGSFNSNEYRVFAHDEWRITPQLLLNTGAMFERDGMGHQNLSPRVALNANVIPLHTLRMGVSVAYRTPAMLEERYPVNRFLQFRALYTGATAIYRPLFASGSLAMPDQTITSPGLKPEKLLSREIGYLGQFPNWDALLDVRFFSDQVSSGIHLNGLKLTFENEMSAAYQGVEATLKKSFSNNSDLTVNFAHELANSNLSALVVAGKSTATPASPWISDVLGASIPRNSASLLYSQRFSKKISFSASYYYQDSLQPYDRGSVDYQPIQRRVDVRLAKEFRDVGGMSGEVSLVVQNLFNQGYTEYIANNVFNRRSYVTFTFDW
ncbi:MAG: TonB-dependent receptor [Gallionella sp.]|jgi:iron complex outermembrane receptor protein|nr:TonB-dependent receptor [Gallionella sp.]MCK9353172.1 TonB-dependent receptor [Gallionella sp.]